MSAPGADEAAVRDRLLKLGVGPDADTDPAPATLADDGPEPREKDWLDDILDSNATSTPAAEAEQPEEDDPAPEADAPKGPKPTAATKTKPQAKTRKRKKRRSKKPGPNTPHTPWDTRPQDPRQSLMDAYDRVPYRLKWLVYHASAAYLGWSAGLVDYATGVTAWIADGRTGDPQAWFFYLLATGTFLLYRRTRGHWWPVAWCAAIPVTSTVVGVLLYAPTP